MNLIKGYADWVKKSIIPEEPTHTIEMDILIRRGDKTGRALIPCAIYTLTHSVDLNPSLVMKRTKQEIRELPVNQPFSYHPESERVKLEDNERIEWREEERCAHCSKKLVIAEVSETRYRSCPEISITLSDPVKEDTKIPATFGIVRNDIYNNLVSTIVFNVGFIFIFYTLLEFKNPFELANVLVLAAAMFSAIWFLPRQNYKAFKLWQWFNSVKNTLKPIGGISG